VTPLPTPSLNDERSRAFSTAATLALLTALAVAACGGSSSLPAPGSPTGPGGPGSGGAPPNLPGTLQSGCLGWPGTDFSPTNKANVATFLAPGQLAIDFALRDTNGVVFRLSELLATRPVLLIAGSFT
jgi:hypothetical protein